MTGPTVSDEAVQAACDAYCDAGWDVSHEDALVLAIAAGLRVELEALADKIKAQEPPRSRDWGAALWEGWNYAVERTTAMVRAAAGGAEAPVRSLPPCPECGRRWIGDALNHAPSCSRGICLCRGGGAE